MVSQRVALGKVGRAHGIQGAFHVWPYADDFERFERLKRVTITRGPKSVEAKVESVHVAGGRVIMQTDAVHTPEEVSIWLGGDIEIEAEERVELPPGQYFHDQIVGLQVETVKGEKVGEVVRVLDGPANDVYVCRQGDKEYMIPAVDVFVKSIDLKAKKMVIDPIPGMLE